MGIDKHLENRTWAFEALDTLRAFLDDDDFEGDVEAEQTTIDRKYKDLLEGKYRVVFLGAFNVGKSTLINAFLGDEYLPTILEECTTKITHVYKSNDMKTVVRVADATNEEVQTLSDLIDACGVGATVSQDEESRDIVISYSDGFPKALLKSLNTLVTSNAEEDFPQLRSLRNKFEEIYVHLPTDVLEEDIALVDSPGVHSISETNRRIAEEIIPNSHLVVCLLDSQYAGTEQNRDFIEKIVKHRHRKMFFVINKSDQLNEEEIDPMGRRGPAKDLFRSLEGVVEKPELFFVSSLYALIAAQLEKGQLDLDDLDENHKIKIPFSVQRRLLETEDPVKGAAEYLLKQSNFTLLKSRLLDYLYTENREGAIVESICLFLDAKAWKYARPIEVKLDMARNIPRIEELGRQRQHLTAERDGFKRKGTQFVNGFTTIAQGGQWEGKEYPGYEAIAEERFNKHTIDNEVIKPLRNWLDNEQNLKHAKREGFAPLTNEVQRTLETFLASVQGEVNRQVQALENHTRTRVSEAVQEPMTIEPEYIEAELPKAENVEIGLGGSYFGFGLAGLILGGAAGAGIAAYGVRWEQFAAVLQNYAEATLQNAAIVGAVAGAVIGVLLGLAVRGLSSKGALRTRLAKAIEEQVTGILLQGSKNSAGQAVPAIRDHLIDALRQRRESFKNAVQQAFDKVVEDLNERINVVTAEQEELEKKQRATIERLEPKLETLQNLGGMARKIAEESAVRPEA
jgi:GTPase SAR1 family protein/gas vesicle protein